MMTGRVPARRVRTIAAVVVNYNYAQFVADAIDSVLAQSLPFDKIIVVNDGSTDASMSVIDTYAGRVTIIDKPNGGQLHSVLAGVESCDTDYVYVLDADDYIAPYFNAVVQPLLAGDPIKVQVQLIGVDGAKQPLQSVFPLYPELYEDRAMIEDNRSMGFYICPPTSGNIYRRDFLLDMRLERINPKEFIDGPPTLAAPYFGKVVSANQPLAYYRVHGLNHSQWERPHLGLLTGEIDWFYRRWIDVGLLRGETVPPFGNEEPFYVLERRVMIACLGGPGRAPVLALRALRSLARTHMPLRQRTLLTAWFVLLLVPSDRWRRYLIAARRSPVNRSAGIKRILQVMWSWRRSKPAHVA